MRSFRQALLLAGPLSLFFAQEAGALVPCPAGAARCTDDWLTSQDLAERRLRWARNCALKNSATSLPIDTGVPASNGGTLKEYYEYDPNVRMSNQRSYMGLHFNINGVYVDSLYSYGATRQDRLPSGQYVWERDASLKWTKPLYPTYGTTANPAMGSTLYPNDSNPNDCNLYTDVARTVPATDFYLACYCLSGCYTAEQKVLFDGGYQEIAVAMNAGVKDVMTLGPSASLDNLRLQKNVVASYVTDLRETDHEIFDIKTEFGGHLRVTSEHPLVVSSGRVVAAHTLRIGDHLVNREGSPDRITELKSTTHHGKVYNLRPASSDLRTNILVAQDYLNGSVAYQNEYQQYLNRLILSRSIPEALVPK